MPSVQIVHPVAGETLFAGSTYIIEWTSFGATNQRIQYSLDGGTNFSPIQNMLGPDVRQFSWLIPNGIVPTGASSVPAIVRVVVRDANNVEAVSVSNVTLANLAVTSITPNHGALAGNTQVSIAGTNFDQQVNVKFGTVDGVITQVNPTLINVITPTAMTAGPVDLKVKNPNVTGVIVTSGFTYDAPAGPTIASINPNHGPIAGNTAVTIIGTNFDPQVNMKFGDVDGVITQKSATQIMVNSPAAMAAGAVQLKVKNPNVPAATGTFTYDAPAGPTITSINPNHGPIAGNTSVTIIGTNFDPQVNVKFGDVDGTITQKSTTQIMVNSPAAMAAGAVQLKVKNPNVPAATGTFTYDAPAGPTISSINPTHGPIAGNTQVTIVGTNFDPQVNVKFGDVDGVITQKSATQITVNSPAAMASGAVQLKVKNPNVPAATGTFTYDALPPPTGPTINDYNPKHGPITGNTAVTIIGTNFDPQVNVKFGDVDGVITQKSTTQIIVNSPAAMASGAVQLKVKNPNVPAATGTFTYDAPAGPTITSINPNHGPIAGNTSVTIIGTNFDPQVNVKFGDVDGTITQKSATQITVNSPAVMAAGAVQLKVKNPNVPAATGTFTYDAPAGSPVINEINPAEGPTSRSISVVVTGANFVRNSTVRFGGVDAKSVTFDNSGQLTVETPKDMTPGSVRVKIINPDQTTAVRDDGFRFDAPPMISSVDPPEGPREGGVLVNVLGMNFKQGATVSFGGTLATGTPMVNADGTSISCTLPPGQKGSVTVRVDNPAPDSQTGSRDAAFTYLGAKQQLAARIFSISPKTVLLETRTKMTVKGRNLKTAIELGTFAVRGPDKNFATITMNSRSVDQPPGTQEDIVTFYLTITRPLGLTIFERVPYQVVASVRPKSRKNRIFETSRNGMFSLVTNSAPLAFGITAQLIDGTANMILVSGRNLKGSSITLTDKSGASMPISYVDDRENLLIVGATLPGGMVQSGAIGSAMLTLIGPGKQAVGNPIALDVMPGSMTEDDNDVPAGSLKPVPGQKVTITPPANVGLYAFASSGDGGDWLPGDPIFGVPDVSYIPILSNAFEFAIELVNESFVAPTFGRTQKAKVGVFKRVRAVPLVIHVEITLFILIRVYVFQQGDPFADDSIGEFNDFAIESPGAFGTYLGPVTVSSSEITIGFVIGLVLPSETITVLLSLNLNFNLSADNRRLIIEGTTMLGVHINAIRPLNGASNLLLAAPSMDASPISDLASFLGYFFPTEAGPGCMDWQFDAQFTNTLLDGTPVDPEADPDNVFVVRICTQVEPFPGELLKLHIDPPSFVLREGQSATATAVDMNGKPSPIPVRFELDSAAQTIAMLGPQTTTSNSVEIMAQSNLSGGGRIRASASTPAGFALFPATGLIFSFAAATGVSAEIDSALVAVGADPPNITIIKPSKGQMFDCDEMVQCQGMASQGNADLSNKLMWETPHKEIVSLCDFDYKPGSLKFADAAASPVYNRRSLDYSDAEGFKGADIIAKLPGTNANPAKVTINCKNPDGTIRCKAWRERAKSGALAQLVHVIAVEGLDLTATERRQIGYAAANIWRYGRCFRFTYGGKSRRPISLEDGIFSIQEFERTNNDANTRARFQRFDPNTGSGPSDCTECVDYADAVAAAKEILADKKSEKEFAARFANNFARPSHAVAFDKLENNINPKNPNTYGIFLIRRQQIEPNIVACQSYRRLKIPLKILKPGKNDTFDTCTDLIVEWNASGTEQFAQILVNGDLIDPIAFGKPCAESARGTYRIRPSIVPKGKNKVEAIIRVTVRNRCVLKDSEAELTGKPDELGEVNDEVFLDVPITINLPELTIKISTPTRNLRVTAGAMLLITWKSMGTETHEVLVSYDDGKMFRAITDFPLDCNASNTKWKVAVPEGQGSGTVPAIIRVEVTNVNGKQHDDVPIVIVVPKKP